MTARRSVQELVSLRMEMERRWEAQRMVTMRTWTQGRFAEVVHLHDVDGLTYAQIGECMGVSGSRAHQLACQFRRATQVLARQPSEPKADG